MFTGLVQERGRIATREPSASGTGVRLTLAHSAALGERLAPDGINDGLGASLAVNGVCLTLIEAAPERSTVELSPETLARTTLNTLPAGSPVNLEPAMRAGDALGGHWVQGHVDTTVAVVEVRSLAEGHKEIAFALPPAYAGQIVEKGSVTLDGVSLTVSRLGEDRFEVALIPHTLSVTTLDQLSPGDRVNLEIDVLARYVTRYVEQALKTLQKDSPPKTGGGGVTTP